MSRLLGLTRKAVEAIGALYVALQVEQVQRGLNREGLAFPPGVTLIETGRMLASISYRVDGDEVIPFAGLPMGSF